MIAEALEFVASNQLLTAGIGTVLFGSLMYVVKGVPIWCYATARRMLTIELQLTSDTPLYHEMLRTLTGHRVAMLARNYSLGRRGAVETGYGQSVAWYRGRLVIFKRSLIEKGLKLDELLHLTMFSRDVGLLRALIDEAKAPIDPDCLKLLASTAGGYWDQPMKKRKRSLDTVFTNAAAKESVVAKITWFLANEDWYRRRGIPYKLVILLHGEPGTGKTSIVYGLASQFGRSLATVRSVNSIDYLLRYTPNNAFVVIEDIDMLSVSREEKADAPAVAPAPGAAAPVNQRRKAIGMVEEDAFELSALHALINALDGLGTPDGLILFITTNYKDRLDPALIRPGRVDMDVEIGRLDRAETAAMFVAFYGEAARPLITAYTGSSRFRPRTGADLQVLFMSANAVEAVARLDHVHAVQCAGST